MSSFVLNPPKYKSAIKFIIHELKKVQGKKKMYKLMYFLDFDFYEAYNESFTGESYRKLAMGPAPVYFDDILKELEDDIDIKHVKISPMHENDTCIYSLKKDFEFDFSEKEAKMLKRIVTKYGSLNGKQLEDLSHAEAPWNAVSMFDLIPYDYALYRDTQDLNS